MDDGRRKTHFVQYIDDKSLRRAFYQALLDIEWLPSKIHSAVMSELGLSLQKRKSDIEEAREQREATFMILRWPRSLLGTA